MGGGWMNATGRLKALQRLHKARLRGLHPRLKKNAQSAQADLVPLLQRLQPPVPGSRRGGLTTIWPSVLLAFLLLAPPALAAQSPTPASDAVALDAISRLRSPYCPGLMLEVCPSPQAGLLRDSIHQLAAEGRDADALVEWTIARHGEEWRAVPKQSGVGLWAWLLPPLALLFGGGWIVAKLRGMRRAPTPAEPNSSLSAHERERLAVALREWESAPDDER